MLILIVAVLSSLSCNVEACSETFTGSAGTIQSPGYPDNYANNLDCVYVIKRPEGERITLTFQHVDLQGACTQDFLELRDGDSSASPFLGSVCGTQLGFRRKRTFQNNMYIRFLTDGSENGTGFSGNYNSGFAPDNFFLIASSGLHQGISRMDVETTSSIAIPGLNVRTPFAVDFDPVERRVYWTDLFFKTISSAYLNGTGQTNITMLNTAAAPEGLALDPVTRLVFYTDAGNDVIAMMTTSGLSKRTIISTGLDQPRAIVLDTMKGVMFWGDWGTSAKIERANYDGTDRKTIITGSLIRPNGLALDLPTDNSTADTNTGTPVAVVGGVIAGGGVFILIIIVVVVIVIVIRRKRNPRYENPRLVTRNRILEAQVNPNDRLGLPGNQDNQGRCDPFIHDVQRLSSINDEVGHMEETDAGSPAQA